MDIVEVVMELEDHYDIAFTDEAAERLKTPDDIVNYLKTVLKVE